MFKQILLSKKDYQKNQLKKHLIKKLENLEYEVVLNQKQVTINKKNDTFIFMKVLIEDKIYNILEFETLKKSYYDILDL